MTPNLNKPTLVTGGSGFVGNNLVRHLLDLGRNVRVLVHGEDKESLSGLNVEIFHGDVLQPDTLSAAMNGVSTVFHLAGVISIDGKQGDLLQKVNVEGTANVVEACLAANVDRLVHFSSVHAFSHLPKNEPIDETRALAIDSNKHLAYDRSKAQGEQKVTDGIKRGLDAVILNPVGIFGPNDFDPSPGGEFLLQLVNRKLPGLVRAGYFWVDVRDVAIAAVAAETKGRCGEKYILCGEYGTFKTIARWIHEITGSRPPLLNVPIWLAIFAAPLVVWYSGLLGLRPLVTPDAIKIVQCHQLIKTDKAAKELDFQPRPLEQTIVDTVQWLSKSTVVTN